MQSLMIGLGSIASAFAHGYSRNILKVSNTAAQGSIAENVKWSFYTGASFLFCSFIYRAYYMKEYPINSRS